MSDVTGVGCILSASHIGDNGVVHGHSWEVIAWFNNKAHPDALVLQHTLKEVVSSYDHKILPAEFARAEELAARILSRLNAEETHCVEVEISRPLERLYARAR